MHQIGTTMYNFILNLHSGIAYAVIAGLVIVVLLGLIGLLGDKPLSVADKVSVKVTTALIHLQALAGIILWVVSPKIQAYLDSMGEAMGISEQRKILVEHPITMLIAVVVFTIGGKKFKTATDNKSAHKKMLIYGAITLVLVLSMVPWNQFLN